MKSSILWDITPHNPLNVNRRFEGTALLLVFHAGLLLSFFFDPKDGSEMFFRNVDLLSTDYTVLYPLREKSLCFVIVSKVKGKAVRLLN
jgi:hypothetical protein